MSGTEHALKVGETNDSGHEWRKSSRSYGSGNCVEVALCGEHVCVRDSKDLHGTILQFTPADWNAFKRRICK